MIFILKDQVRKFEVRMHKNNADPDITFYVSKYILLCNMQQISPFPTCLPNKTLYSEPERGGLEIISRKVDSKVLFEVKRENHDLLLYIYLLNTFVK